MAVCRSSASWVSLNSRALSSATPMLAATVLEQAQLGFVEGVLALAVSPSDMTAAHLSAAAHHRHETSQDAARFGATRVRSRGLAWLRPGSQ